MIMLQKDLVPENPDHPSTTSIHEYVKVAGIQFMIC